MRLYETTSTVTQNESVSLKRYAHTEYGMRLINGMMIVLLVLMVFIGITVYRVNHKDALACVVIVLIMSLVFNVCGRILLKYGAKEAHPYGAQSYVHTTWYDGEHFHRRDADGDEFSWPIRKVRYARRIGTVILLCTSSRALIPVNLLLLSETDRRSFFKLLEEECPKLIILE